MAVGSGVTAEAEDASPASNCADAASAPVILLPESSVSSDTLAAVIFRTVETHRSTAQAVISTLNANNSPPVRFFFFFFLLFCVAIKISELFFRCHFQCVNIAYHSFAVVRGKLINVTKKPVLSRVAPQYDVIDFPLTAVISPRQKL